ncbi:hypothetical protein B7463_g7497, partial [Scytalidium lignicola]
MPWSRTSSSTATSCGADNGSVLRGKDGHDILGRSSAAVCVSTGLDALLDVGKWSCMGMYLIMESSTMLDAMGAWKTTWAAQCLLEANKFWFYSLVFSIIKSVLGLLNSGSSTKPNGTNEKKGKNSPPVKKTRPNKLVRKLLADGFDLLIPGLVTGWIPTSLLISGYTTVASTILTSMEVWDGLR